MKIVLCSEGARPDSGGFGLVAVPQIAHALSEWGHQVVLETFGPLIPGSEGFASKEYTQAWQQPLVTFSYPARRRYSFSREGLAQVMAHAADADFVMLHSLYSFAVLSGYAAARRYGKKYGLWPHGVLAPFQRQVGARKKALYDALLARRILEQASILFYNAVGERDEVETLQLRAPSAIIPHGINPEPFAQLPPRGAFRREYLNGFEGPVLLYLGRLNAKKGLDVLVRAMPYVVQRVPNVRLAIVGAGDPPSFTAQVNTWVRDAGMQNHIVLCGPAMGQAKMVALSDTDVFVLSSYAENFSFAMFEAMACKIPVVISDTLNFAPQVKQYGAGHVVAREPAAFGQALVALLQAPELRAQMGEGGARLAAQYSWNAIGKQMERAIQAIVTNQPLPRDLILGQQPA